MANFKGHEFYDDPEVFEKYTQHRQGIHNPNERIEKPAVLELLNGLTGSILDLGCGYGDLGPEIVLKGATHYTGIDSSAKMIGMGQSRFGNDRVKLIRSRLEDWEYPKNAFDWVISRLVFHYVAELSVILNRIHHTLKTDGKLVFSVEHPVLTSSMHLSRPKGKKQDWMVDEYFNTGIRNQRWMGGNVEKYHRTIEEYWRLLVDTGFRVTDIREGCPDPKQFQDEAEYERRKRIPLFLIIKAVKVDF
ncbi:MAG: methyltransferase domain-containing protein [Lewinellaceae bacterium]|nr:methyltransferase domain-containing protein [Lewinella sp.]MCB9278161.1 methyltransferase domain-containing protein [Lewinellaceae bacterium]